MKGYKEFRRLKRRPKELEKKGQGASSLATANLASLAARAWLYVELKQAL